MELRADWPRSSVESGSTRGGGSNAQIARKSADLPGFPGGSAGIYRRQCPKTGRCRPESERCRRKSERCRPKSERCRPVSERCRPVSSCGNGALLGLGGFQWPGRGGGRWLVLAVQSTRPSRPVERGSVLPASGNLFFFAVPQGVDFNRKSGKVGGIMSYDDYDEEIG